MPGMIVAAVLGASQTHADCFLNIFIVTKILLNYVFFNKYTTDLTRYQLVAAFVGGLFDC